jgi:hypothetical protein
MDELAVCAESLISARIYAREPTSHLLQFPFSFLACYLPRLRGKHACPLTRSFSSGV